MMSGDWLRRALDEEGKTKSGLARLLGVHQSQVSLMLSNRRRIKPTEEPTILRYLGRAAPQAAAEEGAVHSVETKGALSYSLWSDGRATTFYTTSHHPVDTRFPPERQYDYLVADNTHEPYAQQDERVRVLDVREHSEDYRDGEVLIVEQRLGPLRQYTLRRVFKQDGGIRFDPVSAPNHHHTALKDSTDDVHVLGSVLFVYREG